MTKHASKGYKKDSSPSASSSNGKSPVSPSSPPLPPAPSGPGAHPFIFSHSIPRTSKHIPLSPLPIPFYPSFADQLKVDILCRDPSYIDTVIEKVLKEIHQSQPAQPSLSISHSSSLSPLGTVSLDNINDDFFTQPGSPHTHSSEASPSLDSLAFVGSMLQGRDGEDILKKKSYYCVLMHV